MERLSYITYNSNSTNLGENWVGNTTSFDKLFVTAPTWATINQELKWIFPLHSYGFGCLFFVLSFYTLFSILNLRSLIASRPFMISINIFLCLLGISRSGCLFIDPYNLQKTMPKIMGSIMWDIGFPCVTSAFCLVQLAFLHLTQLKFGTRKLNKESCLSFIITTHFSSIIASDVASAFYSHLIFKYVIQLLFLMWSVFLYLIFLHAGYKVLNFLKTLPNDVLTRDKSLNNQKGIMQLAMLAPYNNLATSVAAALVPTLMSQKFKPPDEIEQPIGVSNDDDSYKQERSSAKNRDIVDHEEATSTVPEVYVRPPTPTPSAINLPIITVSCPSRRSSVASSRRNSDVSMGSRRNSVCSVKFINDDGTSPMTDNNECPNAGRKVYVRDVSRRNSEMITPTGSSKDISRRCSDFSHEKNRGSQFATKLRRNSDFGNRTPKRMLPLDDTSRLSKVLDVSPGGSRRNSDLGGLATVKISESRRNSDISYRRNSDLANIRPLMMNRRSSDISIRMLDKSPTHFNATVSKMEIAEKSESDSDNHDCNEKAALMTNDKSKLKQEDTKGRKKSLSWKNVDKCKDHDDITAVSSLLPETSISDYRVAGTDFTLHAILNHIAYVNRAKSDVPLHIPETDTTENRKSQLRHVLNVIYATAILGIILCIADIARIFGPYGLFGGIVQHGNDSGNVKFPKPIPWLIYQTICRFLELIMGCAMASITKQSSVSPRHQYFTNYSTSYTGNRFKQRDNPYI